MEIGTEVPRSGKAPGTKTRAKAMDYDVFLSFRGPDTREGFTDCLYEFMSDKGIRIFRDDEELRPGEKIMDILHAIERSRLYIPVFSKGYASSKWCLRELAHLVECTDYDQSRWGRTEKKEILPIFYDVEPYDVKLETELYNEALRMHEEKGCDSRTVESWKEALRTVAKIKGWHLKDQRHGKVIKEIIQQVFFKITTRNRVILNDLIGIDDQVEAIQDFLSSDMTDDVRFVIIHGMGGIGKTTLAKVIFNQLSLRFQAHSFLPNIRESVQRRGLEAVQRKLLSNILGFSPEIFDVEDGYNMLRNRLQNKRVLIVFDDVDDGHLLEQLAAQSDCFGIGSRIVITTRDIGIFCTTQAKCQKENVMTKSKKVLWHEMKGLDSDHALQLFSKHAFGSYSHPQEYYALAREVVAYTGGLPLGLEVIGSSLHAESRPRWEFTLKKLKQVPHEKVQEKLMISYETLQPEAKQIFLDIACFFANKKKTNAVFMWEACDLFPETELEVLTRKSLIKIIDHDRLWMHDLLRDLGRDIVRQEDITKPGNRSRLWLPEKALHIVRMKKGTENVVALALQKSEWNFTPEHFTNLSSLRYLEMDGSNFVGDFGSTLQELRWFCWYRCPPELQANNFVLRNLVVLKLSNDNIEGDWSRWAQIMEATKLKVLKLTGFRSSGTPDFSPWSNLERLVLKDCPCLAEIDASIGKLERLVYLKIKLCPRLQQLPEEIGCLTALRDFALIQCYSIKILPDSIGNLKLLSRLVVDDSALVELPDAIGRLEHLKYLSLVNCTQLIGELTSSAVLDLSGSSLTGLPLPMTNLGNFLHGLIHATYINFRVSVSDFWFQNRPIKAVTQEIILCKIYRKAISLKLLEQKAAMEEGMKANPIDHPSQYSSPPCPFSPMNTTTSSFSSHQDSTMAMPNIVLKQERLDGEEEKREERDFAHWRIAR